MKDRLYGIPFAASTSTSLSKHLQPAKAFDGRGPVSSRGLFGFNRRIGHKIEANANLYVVGIATY
jgi:hypothetical protein